MSATLVMTERELDPTTIGDHLDRLYRAALALCTRREDAEDLVQDTYARVLAKPRFVRREDDLAYLVRVLRNTFLNRVRTAGRRPQTAAMPDDAEFVAPHGDPHRALESGEVLAAVAALPPGQRDVLVAVDIVGLSYEETARALGMKASSVPTRLARARLRVADAVAA
jgi:RNA polymerase sigma-70 factor, ECF subfamily